MRSITPQRIWSTDFRCCQTLQCCQTKEVSTRARGSAHTVRPIFDHFGQICSTVGQICSKIRRISSLKFRTPIQKIPSCTLSREPIRKMIRLVVLSNAWFEPESTLWRVSHKLDHFIAEWKIIFKLLPNYLSIGQEPWSSGNGRRLMFQSLWVRILAPNTGWTFFHIYSLKRPKINEKEAGVGAF